MVEDPNFLKVKKVFFLISFIFIFTSKSFSQNYNFQKLAQLDGPWGSSFLNNNELIVTEKSGKIKIVNIKSNKTSEVKHNLNFLDYGQGGLLDILFHKNYIYISAATIILFILYYFTFEILNDYDRSFANPDRLGIGRALETIPLLPLTFIISGILFLRKSLLFIFIMFFTLMCGLRVYEIIIDERTYFSNDWNTTISDGFAIYTPVFIVWLNVWIIICIICMASVYLIDRLMRDAVRFEKSTAQFGRYFSPAVREKIQETDLEIKEDENNNQMVAVMFTDIDNFTQLSEKMSSKEIIELLSEYQDRMIKPIFKNSGTVDKFIGDSDFIFYSELTKEDLNFTKINKFKTTHNLYAGNKRLINHIVNDSYYSLWKIKI